MIVDAIRQSVDIKKIPISLLADRHRGVGFDQLLLVEKSSHADFACRIFNADGSEAEQCGNGMRCIARFLVEESLTKKKSLVVETVSSLVEIMIHDYDHIQVNMGIPCFDPEKIPFLAEKTTAPDKLSVDAVASPFTLTVLSMGNPHAILQVPAVKDAPVPLLGAKIALHPAFPNGTNVGFMEIISPQKIRLRTFERGAGETWACGSNACAAVVAGILHHKLDHKVTVNLTYGDLLVGWAGEKWPVFLSGPAARVFSGIYFL